MLIFKIKQMATVGSTSPSSSSFPLFVLLLLLLSSHSEVYSSSAASYSMTVKFLPGFQGPLPFHLETGYVGVGESEDVQLFYYFSKSERNPKEDPLMLWLTGGAGCSALSSLAFEIGPFNFRIEEYNGSLPTLLSNPHSWTKLYEAVLATHWANDDWVQKALGIRQASIGKWERCFQTNYTKEINSSIPFHVELSSKGYRALVYSGDQDLIVPFCGTEAWIRSLNYSIVDEWRPWLVQSQIAGYTRTYSNGMTYATVKGGGHTAPEYKPRECFAMFERWISQKPL